MGTKKNVRSHKSKSHSSKSNKSRRNSILRSWVNFVKKVQKEENIGYGKAMSRAKARKSEWKRGGHVDPSDPAPSSADGLMGAPYDNVGDAEPAAPAAPDAPAAPAAAVTAPTDATNAGDDAVSQTGAGKRRARGRRGGSKHKTVKRRRGGLKHKTVKRRRGGLKHKTVKRRRGGKHGKSNARKH